jgi:protein-S-isoprenylcysteine O-methyltransferase Ste14
MLLKDRFVHTGNVLFRYRGYQYVLMLPVFALCRRDFALTHDGLIHSALCVAIALCGMTVRALTVGFVSNLTSGRNTLHQVAEELNSTGAYSIVRNPLYVGNYLILLGTLMLTQSAEIVFLGTVVFAAFYTPIIFTEEAFLVDKFSERFAGYARGVNCIMPSLKNYRSPTAPFSLKMLLKREHDTWLTTTLGLTAVEILREVLPEVMKESPRAPLNGDVFSWSGVTLDPVFYALILAVVPLWTVLKILKKTRKSIFKRNYSMTSGHKGR